MHRNSRQWLFPLLAVTLLVGVGCALPSLGTPTPFAFPTLALTPTASVVGIPPTATWTSNVTVVPVPPTATVAPPTPQPTPTPAPSATQAPAVRPGPRVQAPLLWVAPNNINGNLDDWRTKDEYPIQSVVFGAANYTGLSDVSGKFRIGWDYRALYVAVIVTDDTLVQTQHGAQMYKGDDVEIQLDTNLYGDFYVESITADDFQIGLSPGVPPGTSPEAYLWYPPGKARALPEAEIAVLLTTHGYIMEAAIPWTVIGFKPSPGLQMGFAINISDNDLPGQAVQQTMVSNAPYRTMWPTSWGTLVFFDPGK